ncbi:YwmB family TATA-box binding protein [Paenibacillus sp. y28]|uniref:YwmB family TATA-box binding protein n=1 Tax=Paenibacillus sp. y28 TaxID=3129110 RepID=UPI003016C548
MKAGQPGITTHHGYYTASGTAAAYGDSGARPGLRFFGLVLLVLLALIGLALQHMQAPSTGSPQDGRLFTAQAGLWTDENARLIYSYRSYSLDLPQDERFFEAAKLLASRLGLSPVTKAPAALTATSESDGPLEQAQPGFTAKSPETDPLRTSLHVTPLPDGRTYMLLSLEGRLGDASAAPWQAQLQLLETEMTALEPSGQPPVWNMMVQGEALPRLQNNPDALWSELSSGFDAKVLSRYADSRTVSQTFDSASLSRSASFPLQHFSTGARQKGTLNLQAALHRDTETGHLRLTLGTPLITIEY